MRAACACGNVHRHSRVLLCSIAVAATRQVKWRHRLRPLLQHLQLPGPARAKLDAAHDAVGGYVAHWVTWLPPSLAEHLLPPSRRHSEMALQGMHDERDAAPAQSPLKVDRDTTTTVTPLQPLHHYNRCAEPLKVDRYTTTTVTPLQLLRRALSIVAPSSGRSFHHWTDLAPRAPHTPRTPSPPGPCPSLFPHPH